MGKVDWFAAEYKYVTQGNVSYNDIAKLYKVAKSTVVRRATKHNWQSRRVQFQDKMHKKLIERTREDRVQVEERELKFLRGAQAMSSNALMDIAKTTDNGRHMKGESLRRFVDAVNIALKTIRKERMILGLPVRSPRVSAPEHIEEYLEAIGLIEPLPDSFYKEVKETIQDADMLIEYRKRLQSYIDEVDQRGTY